MKKFVTTILLALCSALAVQAQTFLEHLQQSKQGQGTVQVTQSKAIDELVNGNTTPAGQKTTAVGKQTTADAKRPATDQKEKVGDSARGQDKTALRSSADDNDKATKAKDREAEKKSESRSASDAVKSGETNEMEIPTVDMRKKVMRNSYKVTGYRVQAFAGGNTRNDKQKAQQIGNAIKMKYPDQPIYVHFYSPRWICRVGNYRSYEEARRMLNNVKAMGYSSATIVKGQITVND
jgi:hypothetical protein